MNLDQALETYIAESRDLLQQMEQTLLSFDSAGADAEAVNALFRAAHTIKGSAGLFSLDAIVGFTHTVESVLDRVRDGSLSINTELSAILLESTDHISLLVDDLSVGNGNEAELAKSGEAILRRLATYLCGDTQSAQATQEGSVTEPKPESAATGSDYWHLSLRFGRDVLRNGMDPLSFIRYLHTVGDVVAIRTITEDFPSVDELDAESCYLGFEIGLRSDSDKAAIESVFDFVRDDCRIRLLPPSSKVSEYIELIKALPEKEVRLGDMLVECGALTRSELDEGLRAQHPALKDAATTEPVRPLGEVLVDQQVVSRPVVQAALDKQRQGQDAKAAESRFIRLDAEKVDVLINCIGELVIAGAGIGLAAKRAGVTELLEAAATLATLVENVRDSALKLRMVQIGATFNRFQRVVHDVSKELGKDIVLAVSGVETELDKTMVERISDPLMHLVRNAMDHGIESTSIRQARGKDARATVSLNAYHDAGSIVIEVSDDGAGLNRERILAKAIERGLLNADQPPLADSDLWNVIFEPGFSTADKISNLSGRGVGMDVVKRSITDLRGTVEIDSVEGAGTTIRIRLPLTLAIIDGFLIGVGNSVFVVPLDMVEECIELSATARAEAHGRDFVNLRGAVLPFIQVRDLFDIHEVRGRRENILVVRHAGQRAGLVVDELLGEAQTVIKPLGKWFKQATGIGGSTILGDGRVALILDVPGLLRHVSHLTHASEMVRRPLVVGHAQGSKALLN